MGFPNLDELQVRKLDNCTVFQAEIFALLLASETLLETDIESRDIYLYVGTLIGTVVAWYIFKGCVGLQKEDVRSI